MKSSSKGNGKNCEISDNGFVLKQYKCSRKVGTNDNCFSEIIKTD